MGGLKAGVWALLALPLFGQSPEALLAKVDKLRHPWPAFSVEVALASEKGSQRWRVHARANGDARVEGLSEKEKGRSVLLLGEQMWLLAATSKRPMRISPQQRVMGPAAGGDIARTRFGEDYTVARAEPEAFEGAPATRLDLAARRPSISYRTVSLWVADDGRPLAAAFHLASGKLAKRVRFEAPTLVQGVRLIPGMALEEPGGGKATLRFSAWAPGAPDPALFELPGN
ncbi:MAG: outer membrane lipoprotein-sorting protein [Acidobacteria bacterium]|nr:outer membrane lipoprotein-sorting protein [Acidobacteriota bacterium]